ncbi:major tail protein [uncultured Clostridium sp.]|uniref:major tail protein n=1 Tax=uncultured Clostridium sp. TaxID=59620 RepID=UPI00262B5BDC|nr:major tail protein [uncultured Clostridium sp.]
MKNELNSFGKFIGLSDIFAAKVLTNNSTEFITEEPFYLADALSAKYTPKFNEAIFWGNDLPKQTMNSFQQSSVELKVATLPLDRIAKLLGKQVDKNGTLIDSANDKAPTFALGYRSAKSDGTAEFTWIYCVTFSDSGSNYESKTDKLKGQDITIKGIALSREKDNYIRVRNGENDFIDAGITTAKDILDTWFAKVYEPDGILTPVMPIPQIPVKPTA